MNNTVMTLWQRSELSTKDVEEYTVGEDYILDLSLLPWDCLASLAHGAMLNKIGVLNDSEFKSIKEVLLQLYQQSLQGKITITQEDEDCHTVIERNLTEKLGEAGKKIHTARSRNDQVQTALKLFMKAQVFIVADLGAELASELLTFAAKHNHPMPGYSHMQRAMPATSGLWAASHAEGIITSLNLLNSTLEFLDSSPLGSASGFGVSIPIDREYTAKLLGFSQVARNVLAVQNSRGRNEAQLLWALSDLMFILNKIASDALLFSTAEFGFFTIPKEFCTGSSLMPNKRNPDVLELMRAKAKSVQARCFEVCAIIQDLPSGYNRDFQLTKKPLLEGIEITKSSLRIITRLLSKLELNPDRMKAAMEPGIYATDLALKLASEGVPFRDAYHRLKDELAQIKSFSPEQYIDSKTHTGAPGNLGLADMQNELNSVAARYNDSRNKFEAAISKLTLP